MWIPRQKHKSGIAAAAFSCPTVDPDDPHSVAVAIRYGDSNPAARPLIIKMIRGGGVGHLLDALDWPEIREMTWQDQDGTTWKTAAANDLRHLPQPEEVLEPATADAASGYSSRDFWAALGRDTNEPDESLIERTRRLNRELDFVTNAHGDGLTRRQRAALSAIK